MSLSFLSSPRCACAKSIETAPTSYNRLPYGKNQHWIQSHHTPPVDNEGARAHPSRKHSKTPTQRPFRKNTPGKKQNPTKFMTRLQKPSNVKNREATTKMDTAVQTDRVWIYPKRCPRMVLPSTNSCAQTPMVAIIASRPLLSSLVFICICPASSLGMRPSGSNPKFPGS